MFGTNKIFHVQHLKQKRFCHSRYYTPYVYNILTLITLGRENKIGLVVVMTEHANLHMSVFFLTLIRVEVMNLSLDVYMGWYFTTNYKWYPNVGVL
jgi:hypothetical protein